MCDCCCPSLVGQVKLWISPSSLSWEVSTSDWEFSPSLLGGHPACWAKSPLRGRVDGLLMHRLRTCAARLRPLTAQTVGQQRPAPATSTGGARTFQPLRCYTTPVASEPFLNGTSSNYVEEMYYAWLENPKSVHKVSLCWSTDAPVGCSSTSLQVCLRREQRKSPD